MRGALKRRANALAQHWRSNYRALYCKLLTFMWRISRGAWYVFPLWEISAIGSHESGWHGSHLLEKILKRITTR